MSGERHADRRVLITGAAKGIGRATAAKFVSEGARVALLDVDPDSVEEARRELAEAGGDVLGVAVDVADEDAVREAVNRATGVWGGLDVIVANAGIMLGGLDAPVHRLEREVWQRTIDVNLTGAFLTAKHGIRPLLAGGGGSIVCVTSPAGLYGLTRGQEAYSASKGGMYGLIRVMAADYAEHGIRVNGVLPGIVETPMNAWAREDPAVREALEAPIPLQRLARAEEIASVIGFLASEEASYVTGAVWAVDGGLTAV